MSTSVSESNLPVRVRRRRHRSPVAAYLLRAAAAAVDVALLRAMMGEGKVPATSAIRRVKAEVDENIEYYLERGFAQNPAAFHGLPEAPRTLEIRRRWLPQVRYERVSFRSEYEPPCGVSAARARWDGYHENRTAYGWLLRHTDDRPRPWLICLHGLGTGSPWMDLPAFRAERLHHGFGMNLLFPLLPMHGRRRARGMDRGAMLSFQLLDTIHALAQAVWDTRRLIAWARAEGASRVGLYGLSIGAYTASLVAGLEDTELLLAGIPVADIPTLYDIHTPAEARNVAADARPSPEAMSALFRVVSPADLPPRTPPERRFIYAGRADQITPPVQAERLARIWGGVPIEWFDGGHVSFYMSEQVERFVDRVLHDTGFAWEATHR